MKRLLLLTLAIVSLTAGVAAGLPVGELAQDSRMVTIQGFAPNGLYSSLLTLYSTNFDMSAFRAFSIFAPADCKMRLTVNGTKAGSISEPVFGGQWNTAIVNQATPFVNISGCTGGNLRRQ